MVRVSGIARAVAAMRSGDGLGDDVVRADHHGQGPSIDTPRRRQIGSGLQTEGRVVGCPEQVDRGGRNTLNRQHQWRRRGQALRHHVVAAGVANLEQLAADR